MEAKWYQKINHPQRCIPGSIVRLTLDGETVDGIVLEENPDFNTYYVAVPKLIGSHVVNSRVYKLQSEDFQLDSLPRLEWL